MKKETVGPGARTSYLVQKYGENKIRPCELNLVDPLRPNLIHFFPFPNAP